MLCRKTDTHACAMTDKAAAGPLLCWGLQAPSRDSKGRYHASQACMLHGPAPQLLLHMRKWGKTCWNLSCPYLAKHGRQYAADRPAKLFMQHLASHASSVDGFGDNQCLHQFLQVRTCLYCESVLCNNRTLPCKTQLQAMCQALMHLQTWCNLACGLELCYRLCLRMDLVYVGCAKKAQVPSDVLFLIT